MSRPKAAARLGRQRAKERRLGLPAGALDAVGAGNSGKSRNASAAVPKQHQPRPPSAWPIVPQQAQPAFQPRPTTSFEPLYVSGRRPANWVLTLPDSCYERIIHHCSSRPSSSGGSSSSSSGSGLDLPGIKGMLSLLRASRTAYSIFHRLVYDAIDPGCVAAMDCLVKNYREGLQATQKLAEAAAADGGSKKGWSKAVAGPRLDSCSAEQPVGEGCKPSEGCDADRSSEGSSSESDTGTPCKSGRQPTAAPTGPATAAAAMAATRATAMTASATSASAAMSIAAATAIFRPGSPAWEQSLRKAAAAVMRSTMKVPPARQCPVRPLVQALWKAQLAGACSSLRHPQACALGIAPDDLATLPFKMSTGKNKHKLFDTVAVLWKVIHDLGPGSLANTIPDPAKMVRMSAWEAYWQRPDPAAGSWLLSLPTECMPLLTRHLCGPRHEARGIRGLMALLLTCRTAYSRYSQGVFETIDPGCGAAWKILLQQRDARLEDIRRIAQGEEGAGIGSSSEGSADGSSGRNSGGGKGSSSSAEGSSGRNPGGRNDSSGAGASYGSGGTGSSGAGSSGSSSSAAVAASVDAACRQQLRQRAAAHLLILLPSRAHMCPVRPNVQALWKPHKPTVVTAQCRRRLITKGYGPRPPAYWDDLSRQAERVPTCETPHAPSAKTTFRMNGPGSHAPLLENVPELLEKEMERQRMCEGEPEAGPWLLLLPGPCLEAVVQHCTAGLAKFDMRALRSLVSLLMASKSAHATFSPLVYEVLDPGCQADWNNALHQYQAKLEAHRRLAGQQQQGGVKVALAERGEGSAEPAVSAGPGQAASSSASKGAGGKAGEHAAGGAGQQAAGSADGQAGGSASKGPAGNAGRRADDGVGEKAGGGWAAAGAPLFIGEVHKVVFTGEEAQQFRSDARSKVLAQLKPLPHRKCTVRPNVTSLWRAQRPDAYGKPQALTARQVYKLGLEEYLSSLPRVKKPRKAPAGVNRRGRSRGEDDSTSEEEEDEEEDEEEGSSRASDDGVPEWFEHAEEEDWGDYHSDLSVYLPRTYYSAAAVRQKVLECQGPGSLLTSLPDIDAKVEERFLELAGEAARVQRLARTEQVLREVGLDVRDLDPEAGANDALQQRLGAVRDPWCKKPAPAPSTCPENDWNCAKSLMGRQRTQALRNVADFVLGRITAVRFRELLLPVKRRKELVVAMAEEGCALRSDSELCNAYINTGNGDPKTIAGAMRVMKFFYEATKYREILCDLHREARSRLWDYGSKIAPVPTQPMSASSTGTAAHAAATVDPAKQREALLWELAWDAVDASQPALVHGLQNNAQNKVHKKENHSLSASAKAEALKEWLETFPSVEHALASPQLPKSMALQLGLKLSMHRRAGEAAEEAAEAQEATEADVTAGRQEV